MITTSFTHDPYFRSLKRRRIGVLMGGRSTEREVSFMSGRGVMAALLRMGFDAVGIDAASNLEKKLKDAGVEVAFLALHGRWGEDGTVQGLLEYMNLPYTGSGVHASALAMNKVSSKQIFRFNRIPTAPFFRLQCDGEWERAIPSRPSPGFPLIVKPYNEGSSIGCHLVKNRAELVFAVRKERLRYPRLFAEKYIRGKELTVGILERQNGPEVLPILELTPKRKFYDYAAKYTEGLTDFIIPAEITAAQTRRVKALALRVHEALNCHGYSRTDFILEEKTGAPYVLELNTLPGLTALSDIPAQARAAGMTYDELIYFILRSSQTTKRSMKRAYYED
jgi:D-alanine-D-alanine ligase